MDYATKLIGQLTDNIAMQGLIIYGVSTCSLYFIFFIDSFSNDPGTIDAKGGAFCLPVDRSPFQDQD